MIRRMTTLTALALVAASGAWAQTARQGTSGATAAPAPAGQVDTTRSACLRGLDQMAVQMDEDGYWLTGWRGTVADPAMPPAVVPGAGPATGGPAAAGGTGAGATAPAAGAARPVGPGAAGGPWGDQTWTASPGAEIRTLYGAAAILGQRGDEAACQAVLASLTEVYTGYVTQLREAGVEPGTVTGWRAEQIAAARPVTEMGGTLSFDRITGTDVRNPRDEHLGSIENLVVDPGTGQIAYAVIEHGGFLGFGGKEVAVPWSAFKVTPGMGSFVLDVSEEQLEAAPDVELSGDSRLFEERRREIDSYWQRGGRG